MSVKLDLVANRAHLPANKGGVIFAGVYIEAARGTNVERKKHMIFCIDISSSMAGDKLENAKEAVIGVIRKRMKEGDKASLITFSNDVKVQFNGMLDSKSITNLESIIKSLKVEGLTALHEGLEKAGEMAAKTDNTYVKKITLLSDGMPTSGPTDPKSFESLASSLRGRGNIIDVVGLGTEYDPDITRSIANIGGGRHWHVTKPDELSEVFSRSTILASSVVNELTKLRVSATGSMDESSSFLLVDAVYYAPLAEEITFSTTTGGSIHETDLKPIEAGIAHRIIIQFKAPPRPEGAYRVCKVELIDKKTNNVIANSYLQINYTGDSEKTSIETASNPRLEFFIAKERIALAKSGSTTVDKMTKLETFAEDAEKAGAGRIALEVRTLIDGIKNVKDKETIVDKTTKTYE